MGTLLLRLEGPMQSWGVSSRFTERDTGFEPSKSGVIGLLCAALGKPRREEVGDEGGWPRLSDLAALRMGVRLDRPGKMGIDFQTAGGGRLGSREYGVVRANDKGRETVMSWRYYLQDASFLVGLESENMDLLGRLHAALRSPVWVLSLGRKAYVPSTPVYLPDGLQGSDLLTALRKYPVEEDAVRPIRVILDDPEGRDGEWRMDVPVDFDRRRFGRRAVRVENLATE